jgi:hypothetical protein
MGFCFGLLFSTKVDLIQKRISIPMYVSVKAFLRKRCLKEDIISNLWNLVSDKSTKALEQKGDFWMPFVGLASRLPRQEGYCV